MMKRDNLNPRCQAVLVGILKGLSNTEIANKLGHSENHIRMQLYKILEHYELHSRPQLLAEYVCEYALEWETKQLEGTKYHGII